MNRILVVDDEPHTLRAIERIFLDKENVELDFADNGATGLEKVQSFSPDAVLLDIAMPGMDGYEVCRRIKSNSSTAGIMVLLVSAKISLKDRLKGYEVAADDYITKPYDPEELKAKAGILLRLKQIQDELKETNLNLEALVEQKTRELIKKERQALIGQMIQGIVHNLRGPLTATSGFAQLAQSILEDCISKAGDYSKDLERDLKKIDGFLNDNLTAQKRLEQLIDNLLVKGRKDASPQKTPLDLNKVITSELNFLEADMDIKHKIKKNLNLASDLPSFLGLYSDFSQIFCNLIRNAAHAMKKSPVNELTITTTYDERNIIIDFQDTGTGIDPQIIDKIFEPFFSTKAIKDTAQEGEPVGTGLGLYTCAEIIKSYGGEIKVKNVPDKGACFSILIPTSLSG